MEINLNDSRILSSSTACFLWGIHDSSLRKKVYQFPEGTIRRFGTTWIVTTEGMEQVFGKRKRGFSIDELNFILQDVQRFLEQTKENQSLTATQMFKCGLDYLIKNGYHSAFAQDVMRVITNQMDSNLFFHIYQMDERGNNEWITE
jgi:Helix-turn-helix domain